jgi:flagellar basal-body rod modification protein FlgD
MHYVSANYTLPAILNSLQPAAVSAVKSAVNAKASTAPTTGTNSGTNSGTSATSATDIGSTFLNLLATELQNQDPTAPVDSTAMVGQMISLNQLDQLISINQTVTGSTGTGSTGLLQPTAATAGNAPLSAANGGAINTLSPSAAGAVASQLPFDPNTLMPLNPAITGAPAVPLNSPINPVTMGSSTTSNNISGGK